ncbi:MAG: hypothetical protein M1319_06115 [Chloroflexi bacterium]|nr:hypothetical protein [Chloroflexota bacterium]
MTFSLIALIRLPVLVEPFDRYGFGEMGKHLAHLVLDAKDEKHGSGMEAANVWARELDPSGLFEWRTYQEIK